MAGRSQRGRGRRRPGWLAACLLVLLLAVPAATATAKSRLAVREYPIPNASPSELVVGPGNGIWFTDVEGSANEHNGVYVYGPIRRIKPSGAIQAYPQTTQFEAYGLTEGADGNIWFTSRESNQIGRLTPDGQVTMFGGLSLPTAPQYILETGGTTGWPQEIVEGPDGAVWFTEYATGKVGRMSPDGQLTEVDLGSLSSPMGIASGPDGNVWVTAVGGLWRITPAGEKTLFPRSSVGMSVSPDRRGVWVPSRGKSRLFDSDGSVIRSVKAFGWGAAVDNQGRLWANDQWCCYTDRAHDVFIGRRNGEVLHHKVGQESLDRVATGIQTVAVRGERVWMTDPTGFVRSLKLR